MSVRSLALVVLGAIFCVSVAVLINRYTKNAQALGAPVEMVSVIVASDDIAPFNVLTAEMLKKQQVAKDSWLPAGSFETLEDAIGRVSLVSLSKGEPLAAGKLSLQGVGAGIVTLIPRGKRAFTIQVPNVASSVAGFTHAGSKVDVLLNPKHRAANDTTGGSPTTLLQDIKVLAVDQRVEATSSKIDPKEVRSITLLVTPDQADMLAQYSGDLQLSLRNPDDTTEAKKAPVSKDQPAETISIVVATQDIGELVTITPEMVKIHHVPKNAWIPPGTVGSVEEAIGRLTRSALTRGDAISASRLSDKGANVGLRIDEGKRAFTVQMPNVASSVAGFTRAGDRVDVYLTAKQGVANDDQAGRLLLENIEILAVDQRIEPPATGKVDPKEVRSVTLHVTPLEAEKLARHINELQLSLRNPRDTASLPKEVKETPVGRVTPPVIHTIRGVQSNYLFLENR